MVFPSVPLYLDPPSWNLQQQQVVHEQQQQQQLQQQQTQPAALQSHLPRPDGGGVGPSTGSICPNSIADRARLAKIPHPEQALKCPRCDSTNTKFCYFNNYSLSQPRHFCKACRRYWTRGGALRNVPVGGGCRRNKRSNKTSGSKTSGNRQAGATTTSSSATTSAGTGMAGLATPAPQLPFMASSLHHMTDYNSLPPNLGLGFSGMQAMDPLEHFQQIHQQFPFLGGLEHQLPTTAIYPNFDGAPTTGSELVTQMASVKMEDNNSSRGLNLARQYNLAVNNNISRNDPIWGGGHGGEGSSTGGGGVGGGGSGGGGWMTNLSGFNSSSTGSLL